MAQTVSIATQAGPVGLTTVFWLNGADDDYTTAAQVLSERGVRLARLREADELLRRLEPAEHALCVIDLASGSGDGQALRAIRKRCAALPELDKRSADEILGYDEHGLPR